MNEAVAVGARHVVVDLSDHVAGTFRGGQRSVHAYAETAETVGIRGRNFDQRDIDWHLAAFKQTLDLAEVDGSVVSATVIDSRSHVGPDKHGIVPKVACHLRRH